MGSDSRNVTLNSKEDDNPNSVDTKQGRDSANTILNTTCNCTRNCTLESFNFQKWVVDNITSMQSKQRELENKINKLIKDSGKKNDETETSEAEEETEMEDSLEKDLIKGDLKHLEDVIRTLKEQVKEDKDNINSRVAHTEKALKNFMNHSLQVLKVSSQNMNALVDHLERKNWEKNLVVIDDIPTSNTTHQTPRHKTR